MGRVDEPVVITGIGLLASVGSDREAVWSAVQRGTSGVRRLAPIRGFNEDIDLLGAVVDLGEPLDGRLKVIPLAAKAAEEAMLDSGVDLNQVDRDRFGCAISAHIGDTRWFDKQLGLMELDEESETAWWKQWFPCSACGHVARHYGLNGPRYSYSTACASGLISVMSAVRAIRDGQCDIALAGGGDVIDPLFAAGFRNMRVLAHDDVPERACRPFDQSRTGFVMGEGGAMFVVERLSHAVARGARIYAEVSATKALAEAHHITGLDADSDALTYLIESAIREAHLDNESIGYINAHGTGTQQNDVFEIRSIRSALGPAANDVCISSTKSMLGHMINAAGCVELAITALALRDGFAPPTINLTDPDPECGLDCLPLVGRANRFQHALKISVAFGGHLVAVVLSRWNDASGFAYPSVERRAA